VIDTGTSIRRITAGFTSSSVIFRRTIAVGDDIDMTSVTLAATGGPVFTVRLNQRCHVHHARGRDIERDQLVPDSDHPLDECEIVSEGAAGAPVRKRQ
jgi:hypothetical protein